MITAITVDELINEARHNPRLRKTLMADNHAGKNVEHVTFDQACESALSGDDSLVPQAETMIDSLNLEGFETRGREWQLAVAGAYPVVPEFLMNRPDCMRSLVVDQSETMPVRLVVDIFASCGFTGQQLRKRGLVMLALTMLLQRVRPVSLEILTSSLDDSRTRPIGLLIPVATKPVNLSVAASLFSPAFFRLLTASYMDVVLGTPASIPADSYHRCKAELNLGPDDLYVEPAIGMPEETQAILGNPREWLQKQLDRILGARQ